MRKVACGNCRHSKPAQGQCPRCGWTNEIGRQQRQDSEPGRVENRALLDSPRWRKFRLVILERDHYICGGGDWFDWMGKGGVKGCGSAVGTGGHVHHIKPRVNYPELTFEASNCLTLCPSCHSREEE